MTHIKKLVIQGFKSFARKTEIPLENSMNVIVGPNGSGKSNITDALCFVLGRLSIKSIRAAKAANLLFSGNQQYKGSNEAYIELVFDNKEQTFPIQEKEVTIKRSVNKNGNSTYKINGKTTTRQDLIELLSTAGIDPNGFNIVLQGEIQSLVKATSEERRKIIEEVAGISIYETRKHKALRELEKTEEKLKEVTAVLRERKHYLRNLEKEKQDAQQHQKLEETIQRCKKSIIEHNIQEKEKEHWTKEKEQEHYNKEQEQQKKKITEHNIQLEQLNNNIEQVNKKIQTATSKEQETLHKDISDLKAEIAGLQVRKENYEQRKNNTTKKIEEYNNKTTELEQTISTLHTQSPTIQEQQKQHKKLQEQFDKLEQQRRQYYQTKTELNTLEHQKEEKTRLLIETEKEQQLIKKTHEETKKKLQYTNNKEELEQQRTTTSITIEELNKTIQQKEEQLLELEKETARQEQNIKREEQLQENITSLTTCPVCKQEVTEEHKHHIGTETHEHITTNKKTITENNTKKEQLEEDIEQHKKERQQQQEKKEELRIEELTLQTLQQEQQKIRNLEQTKKETQTDIEHINKKLHKTREEYKTLENVEEEYDETRMNLQDLTLADIDIDSDINLKQREINRIKKEQKTLQREKEELHIEEKKIENQLQEKEKILTRKEEQEQQLYEKFQEYFRERATLTDKQKAIETDIIGYEHNIKTQEEKINNTKIQKAQIKAHIEALQQEKKEYENKETIKATLQEIQERLQKAQFRISRLGNVNLKALDVYDKVEEQCNLIKEKSENIEEEKKKIEEIITEIDKKKKKTFTKTLEAINNYFTRNFNQLSKKGEVFLELENKKEPFKGGINILIKVGRGKYFDITSLSGGEKTLVALALIFSIQEYKPYRFYIFDEIDAALDKRNSELLAALIKKYMTSGQYIIITHNDTLISEATNLYGVSMQENISKIVSLKV